MSHRMKRHGDDLELEVVKNPSSSPVIRMDHLNSWGGSRPTLATISKKVIAAFKLSSSPLLLSPVPHLFKSNTVPTESDAKLIREAISKAEYFLVRFDQDSSLWKLDSTKKEKTQLKYQNFIRTHKALLSPIRQLPVELLETIFMNVYCLGGSFRRMNPPLAFAISQVSHRWRETALSLHALWDKLPFIELAEKQTREESYISFLSALLQRSGSSPTLNIYIYAPSQEILSHPVVDLIVQHSHRLMSLTIQSGYTTMNAFAQMRGQLPNLERLRLQFWSHPRVGRVDVFELAPRLHEVELFGPYPPKLHLPWSQLTSFNERHDGCGVPNLFRDGSATLKTLKITRAGYQDAPLVPPTTLPVLSSLRIAFEGGTSGVERFLDSLTIPAIEDMKIVYPGPLLTCITSMFSRSQPPHTLQRLTLRVGYTTIDQLLTLFTQIPQLVELDVMFPEYLGSLYRVFDRSSTPRILPSLQVLLFTVIGKIDDVAEILNDIVQTRCNPTATSNEHTPVNGEPDMLRILQINFCNMASCLAAQKKLNRWEMPSTEKQNQELECLESWKKRLLKYLPDREYGTIIPSSRQLTGDGLDELLSCIDCFDMVDIIPLRASNLHLFISYLANKPPNLNFLGDGKYHFRQLAEDILAKWTPPILEHLYEYRWVTKGTKSLVYIPDSADLRASAAQMGVIYGLKDDNYCLKEELDFYHANWSVY